MLLTVGQQYVDGARFRVERFATSLAIYAIHIGRNFPLRGSRPLFKLVSLFRSNKILNSSPNQSRLR